MVVEDIEVSQDAACTKVEATVDGRVLHFTFDGAVRIVDPASAVLACCIYPAMVLGRPLKIGPGHPVSRRLLVQLQEFQEIYLQWWPNLRRVPLEAVPRDHAPQAGESCGSMFSGGVDSFYTFLSQESEITHLVFAGGLDIAPDETDRYQRSVDFYRQFAQSRGKQLVSLWTNIKGFFPGVSMSPHHGQVLAAFGIMLGFSRTLVPATHTYAELAPWGSHPLTDPLLSTETTVTVHHGAMPRREKVRRVGQDSQCMSMLRVCNSSDQYNCGTCEKCLRTRMSLRLLGLNSETLQPLDSLQPVRALRLFSENDLTFWQDNLALAIEVGDREAEHAIRAVVRGYVVRRALKRLPMILHG
jgi:hypothetical protein